METQLRLAIVLLLAGQTAFGGEPRYLGRTQISGSATDLSQPAVSLEDGSPSNRLGGYGSGIAWLGHGSRYALIADRGPGDGATSYQCRFHLLDINIGDESPAAIQVQLLETALLFNQTRQPLIGSSLAFGEAAMTRGPRFDPEAIRASNRNTFFVSDEYGPSILEFDRRGNQIGAISIPDRYGILKPSANPSEELPPINTSGRFPNRGMECLAISADGETLFALMQGPLLQDNAVDGEGKKIGTNLRLLQVHRQTGQQREFLYRLEHPDNGCSEIEAIADDRFLVIERDSKPGIPGSVKHIYEIDLSGATDISQIESLPVSSPPKITPVKKRLFLDLLDPRWNLAGETFPAKIEGISFGPRRADGSRLLLITSDNDFKPDEPTHIFAFAVHDD